ncbi:hypothetical protein Peur_036451 [Populus x canadensis]
MRSVNDEHVNAYFMAPSRARRFSPQHVKDHDFSESCSGITAASSLFPVDDDTRISMSLVSRGIQCAIQIPKYERLQKTSKAPAQEWPAYTGTNPVTVTLYESSFHFWVLHRTCSQLCSVGLAN